MTESSSPTGPVFALLAAALFGVSTPLSKLLLGEIDPVLLASLLYLGSGIGLFLLRLVRRPDDEVPGEAGLETRDYPWLAGAIVTGGVLAPILLFLGLRETPAATASLLLNFEIVATVLIAFFIFRESLGRQAFLAIAVITGAGVVLTWNPAGMAGLALAAGAIVLACVFWGTDNNLTAKISGKDPVVIAMVKGLGAGVISLLIALTITRAPVPGLWPAMAAVTVGFVTYGISIVFFVLALRDLGAARTSAYLAAAPFIGSIASLLLFREVPGIQFLVALVLFLLGVVLLLREKHTHRHLHERMVHAHRHRADDHHVHPHPGEDNVGHVHEHVHEPMEHEHTHSPDLHHRHGP